MLGRLLGAVQIIVGVAMWMHMLAGAAAFHTAAGSIFVLVLWAVAAIALFALPKRTIPLFALLWGGVILWFGVAQTTFLRGGAHWSVQLAHLLLGVAALGLIESLGSAVRRNEAPAG